jgi:hypothetical protein
MLEVTDDGRLLRRLQCTKKSNERIQTMQGVIEMHLERLVRISLLFSII